MPFTSFSKSQSIGFRTFFPANFDSFIPYITQLIFFNFSKFFLEFESMVGELMNPK
jgi:hypothetical protein